MKTERLASLRPLLWLPDSLATKARYGFRADSQAEDGSNCSIPNIEELTLCDGSLKDKVYTLYACGVTGYEGKTFSPKQLVSMIAHRDSFQVGEVCRWIGGIRTEEGIIYGPNPKKKKFLLEFLCDTLDKWTPLKFRSISPDTINKLKNQLKSPLKTISDYELSVYLAANYAQFIFLFIHPFWNRNGRISEEMMHLFCLSNSAGKRHFWQNPSARYNHTTSTRMELVNHLALELLTGTLGDLGVNTNPNSALRRGYKEYFSKEGTMLSHVGLACLSSYHFRFVAEHLTPKQLERYFQKVEDKVRTMISKVEPNSFRELTREKAALQLLDHHLTYTV